MLGGVLSFGVERQEDRLGLKHAKHIEIGTPQKLSFISR